MKTKTKNQFPIAETVYENVLNAMNLPEGDAKYRETAKEILRERTIEHCYFSIVENMTPAEAAEFEEFMIRGFNEAPWISHEDLMVAYASARPEILEKIGASMEGFFDRFVETFNSIRKNA